MTKEEIIKELDELGNVLYNKFGTDGYLERCTIHDLKTKIKALTIPVVSNSYSDCCGAIIDTDEQSLDICTNCGDRI